MNVPTIHPSNEILINVNDPEVAGKQYQSFANAFAYIATQAPSQMNTWAVRFSGPNAEDLLIPEYVTVVGDDQATAILAGKVDFVATGQQFIHSNRVMNCTIMDLSVQSTYTPASPITYTIEETVAYTPPTLGYDFTATPTTGTYSITIDGLTTTPIAYNADAATVQAAVVSLSPLYAGFTVLGDYTTGFIINCYYLSSINVPSISGTNIDLDAGIYINITGNGGTGAVQTITFSDQDPGTGEWQLKYRITPAKIYKSYPITGNQSNTDIQTAINDIFAQILYTTGFDFGAGNTIVNSVGPNQYEIFFQ
jgi:hypothetical protein